MVQTNDPDQLGWDVSIKGETFVIGAPGHPEGREYPLIYGWYWAGRGRAMVMSRGEGGGGWSQQAMLSPGDADDNAAFGNTVDVAGECFLIFDVCLALCYQSEDYISSGSHESIQKSVNVSLQ